MGIIWAFARFVREITASGLFDNHLRQQIISRQTWQKPRLFLKGLKHYIVGNYTADNTGYIARGFQCGSPVIPTWGFTVEVCFMVYTMFYD